MVRVDNPSVSGHYRDASENVSRTAMGGVPTFYRVFCALAVVALVIQPMRAVATLDLVDAVKAEDVDRVDRLLRDGADVHSTQGDGATALHWAAHRDSQPAAALLVRAGADVNAGDDHGVTPLALACLNGSLSMVELLLDAGADAALARTSGESPLMTAARVGNVDVVRRLLAAGADPTSVERSRGQTALMWAVAENQTAVAEVLVELGGGTTARSANGFTPLLFAAQQGNLDIVRVLLAAGADVNESAPDGIAGDTNARTLLREGTDASVLLVAIDSGHAAMARFLLERGADPNHRGAGRTPLHSATQQAMPGVVRALLAAGADPDDRLEKRMPLLSRLITQNNGLAPVTIGATPFWLAASYGDVEIMRALIKGGADPVLVSEDNTTALMVAAGADYVQGQDKYGRRSYSDAWEALQKRALEATRLCVELGLDVNAYNDLKQTPLHGAVYMGGTLIVPYLVEQGANLDVINARGQTAWTIAAKGEYRAGSFYTQEETAEVLEALGADTTIGFDLGRDFAKTLDETGTREPPR